MSAPPVVPPRPARSLPKDEAPTVPPRPAARAAVSDTIERNRFAPSPLNDHIRAKGAKSLRFDDGNDESEDHRKSVVDMPTLGEEGMEYAVLPDEPKEEEEAPAEGETRTVGDDVKLAAPKPKLPAQTAKDRVAAVTRTDSDRAASFGLGKPSSEKSLRKKASTTSQLSGTSLGDDRDGIPEIGQRIPLLAHAGDVQAPSPAPGPNEGLAPRHHSRKTSARGFVGLPEDSYGLHGHGKTPMDKLEKDYYEKHPELAEKEKIFQRHEHDRASDFAMSKDDLNKIVHNSTSPGDEVHEGMPTEDIGYDAHVEYAARQSRPTSTVPEQAGEAEEEKEEDEGIHVEEDRRPEYRIDEEQTDNYSAPILADDEVARDPRPYEQAPAVAPPPERSGSAFEMEQPKSRSTSRPSSTYIPTIDVQEHPQESEHKYEPLFPEEPKESKAPEKPTGKPPKQRFPSKDVWEDAPDSVHDTTTVTSPQPPEEQEQSIEDVHNVDSKRVEELMATAAAENKPRSWVEKQLKMSVGRPHQEPKRFPSRDVWEDSPDSHQLQTTVSAPQQEEEEEQESQKPEVPARPAKRSTEEGTAEGEKPSVPDRPKTKPQVPDKPKPAVAGRVGGKIAALQAGFMADLNKRLQTGPQAPKKEEPVAQDLTEEKEQAPLSDARKSRARGPQRRAPATSKSPGPAAIDEPSLSFSTPRTVWAVEPEGLLSVDGDSAGAGEPEEEPKTLAANMAGEPVAEVNTETKVAAEA